MNTFSTKVCVASALSRTHRVATRPSGTDFSSVTGYSCPIEMGTSVLRSLTDTLMLWSLTHNSSKLFNNSESLFSTCFFIYLTEYKLIRSLIALWVYNIPVPSSVRDRETAKVNKDVSGADADGWQGGFDGWDVAVVLLSTKLCVLLCGFSTSVTVAVLITSRLFVFDGCGGDRQPLLWCSECCTGISLLSSSYNLRRPVGAFGALSDIKWLDRTKLYRSCELVLTSFLTGQLCSILVSESSDGSVEGNFHHGSSVRTLFHSPPLCYFYNFVHSVQNYWASGNVFVFDFVITWRFFQRNTPEFVFSIVRPFSWLPHAFYRHLGSSYSKNFLYQRFSDYLHKFINMGKINCTRKVWRFPPFLRGYGLVSHFIKGIRCELHLPLRRALGAMDDEGSSPTVMLSFDGVDLTSSRPSIRKDLRYRDLIVSSTISRYF